MKRLTPLSGKLPGERRKLIAFLGGLALFLSLAEYLIPKPVPFLRLGLANIPLLLGLILLTPRELLILAFLKILGQGLLNGTLLSYVFLFSASGTMASVLTMLAAHYGLRKLSLAGTGLLGALASNGVQLALAYFLIFGPSARLLAPLFLTTTLVTGFGLGLFTEYFRRRSRWFALVSSDGVSPS